tara:strand:+ start:4329 stop:4550 length:222 start_codon:yes stop_codon:yes gene_type:complete
MELKHGVSNRTNFQESDIMTMTDQIEDVAVGGISIIPTVAIGIGLGIFFSIIPVVLMSVGLKLTDTLFERVVN